MDKDKSIFTDLKNLGFEDMGDISLYEKKQEKQEVVTSSQKEEVNDESCLYDKKIVCPVCGNEFTVRVVKSNTPRVKNNDSDFFVRYRTINPYFYSVWLCNVCGYASMKSDFLRIKKIEIERVQSGICPKWHGRKYPSVYDANIAIERYKICLLNYTIMGSKSSVKALNCLKIAWMYRLLEDTKNEQTYLGQALLGLTDAYLNEDFPISGMDQFTIAYLLGELHRRLGNYDEALKQFSNVVTSQIADRKIKDLAIDQKELIKEALKNAQNSAPEEIVSSKKKEGFFAKLFK